jgi:hypothetical protein
MIDGVFDWEAIAATVDENERGDAYVPIGKIPSESLKKMVNYLRGLPSKTLSFGPPPTDHRSSIVIANASSGRTGERSFVAQTPR